MVAEIKTVPTKTIPLDEKNPYGSAYANHPTRPIGNPNKPSPVAESTKTNPMGAQTRT